MRPLCTSPPPPPAPPWEQNDSPQKFRFRFLASIDCTSNRLHWSRLSQRCQPELPQRLGRATSTSDGPGASGLSASSNTSPFSLSLTRSAQRASYAAAVG